MRIFRWACADDLPGAFDLRECGWQLAGPTHGAEACGAVLLAHRPASDMLGWVRFLTVFARERRGQILMLGIDDGEERARLLRLGFGDVADSRITLGEIEARAERIARNAGRLERFREVGALRLDLLHRDALHAGRPLGLHPREFALLWRLADRPGVPVAKPALLRDVWRLNHTPETNSLAVHVSRLRSRLAMAGLADLVRTAPGGGYVLAETAPRGEARAVPLSSPLLPRDRHVRHIALRDAARAAASPHEEHAP